MFAVIKIIRACVANSINIGYNLKGSKSPKFYHPERHIINILDLAQLLVFNYAMGKFSEHIMGEVRASFTNIYYVNVGSQYLGGGVYFTSNIRAYLHQTFPCAPGNVRELLWITGSSWG